MPFHPYHTIKDSFGLCVALLVFAFFVFYAPNFFASSDNYIPANPMVTPNHIVPEWYLLPYYAILRSVTFDILGIPAKLLGVVLSLGSIILLFLVPWLDTSRVRSARFRPIYRLPPLAASARSIGSSHGCCRSMSSRSAMSAANRPKAGS